MKAAQLFYVTCLVALGAALGLWMGRVAQPEVQDNALAALSERIARLERAGGGAPGGVHDSEMGATGTARVATISRPHRERTTGSVRLNPSQAETQERQRLAVLEQAYSEEPIDIAWASHATAEMQDALLVAAGGLGLKGIDGDVDCRSVQCRVRFVVADDMPYEDVVTYLTAEIAGSMPSARFAVAPDAMGRMTVNMFAASRRVVRSKDPRLDG